jgi:hypothetical protein
LADDDGEVKSSLSGQVFVAAVMCLKNYWQNLLLDT